MARMYPPKLDPETNSAAERKLFDLFEEEFNDEWTILHHVKWIVHDHRGIPKDGETDFIIVHPKSGILILEVKGGRIHYNEQTGRYVTTDRYDDQHDIGDPFEAATSQKYTIINKLRSSKEWPKRRLLFGHAVAFLDTFIQKTLRANAPREIIIDAQDFQNLPNAIDRAFLYWKGNPESQKDLPPSPKEIETLIRLFCLSTTIRNPLLSESARLDEQAIVKLTEKQFRYLRFLSGQARAVIAGCAGSGKTFLAMEKARQLAGEGLKVLFCCYNRALADHLGDELNYREHFDVFDFHQLCFHFMDIAELPKPNTDNFSPHYFNSILPGNLLAAIDKAGAPYDALIVDEGQDFTQEWWEVIPFLLKDPDNGILYIFLDNNQQVYSDRCPLPFSAEPYPLDENCRNTKRIFEIVHAFYKGSQNIRAIGPTGLPVEVIHYHSYDEARQWLRKILHRLVNEEGFLHDEIAVLSAVGQERSILLGLRYGNIELADRLPVASGEILGTTIRKFKGLERKAIILCEVDGRMTRGQVEELLYVGTSRAKTFLIILVGSDVPAPVKERFNRLRQ